MLISPGKNRRCVNKEILDFSLYVDFNCAFLIIQVMSVYFRKNLSKSEGNMQYNLHVAGTDYIGYNP